MSEGERALRVLLVDDQALVRLGFRMLLEASGPEGGPEDGAGRGVEVVGEAGDGATAVRMVAALAPDVVLMDVRMPGVDGIEATRRIVEQGSAARVLVLTTFDLDELAFAALRAGASGFLLKDAQPDELVRALHAVAAGDAVLTPRLTRHLLRLAEERLPGGEADGAAAGGGAAGAAERPERAQLEQLTPRERDVLELVARGLSNTEVAERLVVSEPTVKGHVGRLLAKLGLRDRVQVVVWAYRAGVVSPDDPTPSP